jgi:hypothetical protein
LYFDLSLRNSERGDCDESAAREIVAEYLPADLREAIAVANVRNEYGHLNHITELATRLLESAVEILEKLPDLTVQVTRQRLARVVHHCDLPGEPYRSASFGDYGFRIPSLLRTVPLEVLIEVREKAIEIIFASLVNKVLSGFGAKSSIIGGLLAFSPVGQAKE